MKYSFIRGSLTFTDPQSMLNAMARLKLKIGNSHSCLKKLLRVKNMFQANKREYGTKKEDYFYKYADIKFNILMEYNGYSMIVELQFLLDFMMKAKSLSHQLYEIERNEQFIDDMTRIFDLSKDKYQQLLFNVNSGILHFCLDLALFGSVFVLFV